MSKSSQEQPISQSANEIKVTLSNIAAARKAFDGWNEACDKWDLSRAVRLRGSRHLVELLSRARHSATSVEVVFRRNVVTGRRWVQLCVVFKHPESDEGQLTMPIPVVGKKDSGAEVFYQVTQTTIWVTLEI
jgi:hypothetical protein